jgi:hypothetical protein
MSQPFGKFGARAYPITAAGTYQITPLGYVTAGDNQNIPAYKIDPVPTLLRRIIINKAPTGATIAVYNGAPGVASNLIGTLTPTALTFVTYEVMCENALSVVVSGTNIDITVCYE